MLRFLTVTRTDWVELLNSALAQEVYGSLNDEDIAMLQETVHPARIEAANDTQQTEAIVGAVEAVLRFRAARGQTGQVPRKKVATGSEVSIARAEALSALYVRMLSRTTAFVDLQDRIKMAGRPKRRDLDRWLIDHREKPPEPVPARPRGTLYPLHMSLDSWCRMCESKFGWEKAQTMAWIVCKGRPPETALATASYQMRREEQTDTTSRVVLALDPALTPSEVAEAYIHARRQIVEPSRQRVRPMSVKALRLAEFALQQPEDIEAALWARWIRKWSKRYPAWSCGDEKTERDNFKRAMRSAYTALVEAGWREPDALASRKLVGVNVGVKR
jgi:hypothetical protein